MAPENTVCDSDDSLVRHLECIVYAHCIQLRVASRYLEVIQIDGTCKTNRLGYTLAYICGQDGNSKTFTAATSFLRSESSKNYSFVWLTALPFLYGHYLNRVRVVISDGDRQIMDAIDTAITSRILGRGNAVRRLCFWHRVLSKFKMQYGAQTHRDNDTGNTVYKWIKRCCYSAETENEFREWWDELTTWMEKRCGVYYSQAQHAILSEFVAAVHNDCRFVASAFTRTRSFGAKSTSRMEAENRTLKSLDAVSDATPIYRTVEVESIRQEQRLVEREADAEFMLHTVPMSALKNFLARGIDEPVAYLTQAGAAKLLEQHSESLKYAVEVTDHGFIVSRVTVDANSTLPWADFRRSPRLVLVVQEGSRSRLLCPCTYFCDFGLPCRHTIAINRGEVGLDDIDIRWLSLLLAGHLDSRVYELATSTRQSPCGPFLRRNAHSVQTSVVTLPIDLSDPLTSDTENDETPTQSGEVVMDTVECAKQSVTYQDNMSLVKEILSAAMENPDCHNFIHQRLTKLKLDLLGFISAATNKPLVPGFRDVPAPSRIAPPSAKANCPEPLKKKPFVLKPFQSVENIDDVAGKEKGRKKMTKQ